MICPKTMENHYLSGTYKVKYDIEDLDGEKIINKDEDIEYNGNTDTVMGYDVFKYKEHLFNN